MSRPGLRILSDQLPLILLVLGLSLFLVGFIYDALFAGIPYQDPTPEMQAQYEFHSQIASVIRWTGVISVLSGSAAAIARWLRSRVSSPA